MKKKPLYILLTLLLALWLTACGGSSGGGTDYNGYDAASQENKSSGTAEGGWGIDAPSTPSEDAVRDALSTQINSTLPANTKVILSADIRLETTAFDTAVQAVSQLVGEAGGWFESRSIYQGSGYRNLRATVRVPAQSFHDFLDQAGQIAHLTNRDEYAEDVSEAYYDSESRLSTQRTKLERLQTLLSQADVMEDIIALESAISETELEIEQLTGSLRKYDSLVGYSTITLRLEEVYRLSGDEEPAVTFGQRIASAFSVGWKQGISGLEDFSISVARNWFNLLLLVLLAVIVILLVRWWTRKRGRVYPAVKRPPKPPKPPKPPEPPASEE